MGSYGIDVPYLMPIPVVLIVINIVNAVVSRTAWRLVPATGILAYMDCGLYKADWANEEKRVQHSFAFGHR
jgi:hypothetical protein